MPVHTVNKNTGDSSIEIIADYPVSARRLWNAYADPNQLERFWGPPTYTATFPRHDVAVGGRSHYFMTGPEGDRSAGYWVFTEVNAPHSFTMRDGFADESGTPNPQTPEMTMAFRFDDTDQGSTITMVTSFASDSEMQDMTEMGMAEGMEAALSQLDAVLAAPDTAAPGAKTRLTILGDTLVRINRVLPGDVEGVWRAHHDAEVLRRWQLGPDGWSMPVCDVTTTVGENYRFGWVQDVAADGQDADAFGFTGTVLECEEPYRIVTTEMMTDGAGTPVEDGPETRNELTFSPVADGTLLTLVVTYPGLAARDMILGTGMVDGMEMSYARLDQLLG
ncbi:SRPBCC family protein [Corynebacterium glyciniphilum]|uniref:SRPBCC family protein n=1 Tax=Corynebacterium glyciniphilum TaxID=1404244 RepID=UPI0011AB4237|nr:SRPBCC family protein [Corynebacterium glyciniphilum]